MKDTPRVTSSAVLAALANPTRRRLLDVLAVDGPSTVSHLASRTGTAVGSVSHHIAMLSRAKLVVEAPDLAKDRRERWWRAANTTVTWSTSDFEGDAASEVVAEAAATMNLEHHVDKARAWQARSPDEQAGWLDSAFATDYWLRLTPAELRELSQELAEVLDRWYTREVPEDGMPRSSIFVFAHGIPAEP
jgi:DNA-binding transcriptional ArsR family regulator